MKIWEPKPPGTLWATPGLLYLLIYSATYCRVTETDDLVCHEISRLTGEGFMYLTVREIITIRSICFNNKTAIVYTQCTSLLRFLGRSENTSLNNIKYSVFITGDIRGLEL